MPQATFDTPSAIEVVLDLYIADVRLAASDRTDTLVEIRPGDPDKAADVKAADNTRVEYDQATRTLSLVSRKPLNRFVNFSSRRPESIDVLILLPTDSGVRGESSIGDFQSEGVLGDVLLKTDLGAFRLAETGSLNLRGGVGAITVQNVAGEARVHAGASDIRIAAVDGTAEISTGSGKLLLGTVTGAANLKVSNGSLSVERALSDLTAANANGAVRIGEVVRGKVSATSKNGSVEIGVREGSAAWLELNTGVGRVYNELESATAPDEGAPGDKVEIQAGTKLGDVTVRRAPRLDEEG